MTQADRDRYKFNPKYRSQVLERSRRYRARRNELQRYRDYIHKRIYVVRESVSFYLAKVEGLERELLRRTKEVAQINQKLAEGYTTLREAQIRKVGAKKSPTLSTRNSEPQRLREVKI